jgi:hypothetical protein
VLLISVDGLHASDLSQWVATHPKSNLAALTNQGTTYSNASTSEPSDSFPGLMALVTGGTPKSTGVYYDDSYSRVMWTNGSDCSGPAGGETQYAENIDVGYPNAPLFTSIDASQLPKAGGGCQPVFPHQFLKVNTIFNVAHDAGLYTAWSDKHPAYEIVRGPSNTGAEDLFTPEINNANDPTAISVTATTQYDQIKVKAVLNEIDGKDSSGASTKPVPAIFGMNFQSVSVAQKLVDSYGTPGGYSGNGFTPQMVEALTFVDTSVGAMLQELQGKHLGSSTEVIITAKHGQSPIDSAKLQKIGDKITSVLTAPGTGVTAADIGQITEDDIALIWLKDQTKTNAAVMALQKDKAGANTAHIDYILSGSALALKFGDPATNDRTPDIIVQPIAGTIYSTSKSKVAEHGGFAPDDTHVALLVVDSPAPGKSGSTPSHSNGTVNATPVETRQVAPTILQTLGLDPSALKSVQLEPTTVLPH